MQRDKRQDVHAGTISRAFFTEEASCDGIARVEKQKAEGLDWIGTKPKTKEG